jgi:hypothetical protein
MTGKSASVIAFVTSHHALFGLASQGLIDINGAPCSWTSQEPKQSEEASTVYAAVAPG